MSSDDMKTDVGAGPADDAGAAATAAGASDTSQPTRRGRVGTKFASTAAGTTSGPAAGTDASTLMSDLTGPTNEDSSTVARSSASVPQPLSSSTAITDSKSVVRSSQEDSKTPSESVATPGAYHVRGINSAQVNTAADDDEDDDAAGGATKTLDDDDDALTSRINPDDAHIIPGELVDGGGGASDHTDKRPTPVEAVIVVNTTKYIVLAVIAVIVVAVAVGLGVGLGSKSDASAGTQTSPPGSFDTADSLSPSSQPTMMPTIKLEMDIAILTDFLGFEPIIDSTTDINLCKWNTFQCIADVPLP